MADISKIKLPDGTTYDIKDSRAVVTNNNNSVYTNVASSYIGSASGKPYWKVTIPNIATRWTIITLYFNVQQNYSVGTGGKLIINGYHNSTSPYTWSGLTYSTIGYLSNAITVYACDGTTFYIGGLTAGYCNIDLERILVADSARGVDISETTIERVESLPESYVTATFRQNQYVGDVDNGVQTTFAYSKTGLESTSWLAGWNGYELRAISPSKVNAGKINGHTVNADVPSGAKFTDTTALDSMTGTLPVTHGGTGKTTANDAADNLISGLPAWTANPTDDTYFVRQDTGGTSTFGRVKFSTLWNYIKGKFSGTSPITFSNGAIGINTASTSGYGATKLSTATNSTATDLAATPSAVKTAYDLANTANGTANTALSGVNGTLIYDHTYSISNGVATFTAHVYQKGVEVTNNYADSCFEWSYKLASAVTETPSVVSLGTGKTKTITISTLGYGGYVLGTFTPPSE